MAEITKLKASQVKPIISHNMRGMPGGKANGNEAIDSAKTKNNYSLVDRGRSVDEINQYRRKLEKEIFKYNRKDIVHCVEYIFQLPTDCPPEQEKAFFQACHDFVCQELPMGEKAVFVSQVHLDEFYKDGNGNVVLDSRGNILSKKHLDMMAVPAVPDLKHEGYEWRMCADALTKRKVLNTFHPRLQKFIDNYTNDDLGITKDNPIHATVLHKTPGSGKTIDLSVKQLKEITAKTGITIDKSITLDKLCEILMENRDIKILDKKLEQDLILANQKTQEAAVTIDTLKRKLNTEIKRTENLQMRLDLVTANNRTLRSENELQRRHIAELEKKLEKEVMHQKETTNSWGSVSSKERENELNTNGWNQKEREVNLTW